MALSTKTETDLENNTSMIEVSSQDRVLVMDKYTEGIIHLTGMSHSREESFGTVK
mgnify:CR=1 FL=1